MKKIRVEDRHGVFYMLIQDLCEAFGLNVLTEEWRVSCSPSLRFCKSSLEPGRLGIDFLSIPAWLRETACPSAADLFLEAMAEARGIRLYTPEAVENPP